MTTENALNVLRRCCFWEYKLGTIWNATPGRSCFWEYKLGTIWNATLRRSCFWEYKLGTIWNATLRRSCFWEHKLGTIWNTTLRQSCFWEYKLGTIWNATELRFPLIKCKFVSGVFIQSSEGSEAKLCSRSIRQADGVTPVCLVLLTLHTF